MFNILVYAVAFVMLVGWFYSQDKPLAVRSRISKSYVLMTAGLMVVSFFLAPLMLQAAMVFLVFWSFYWALRVDQRAQQEKVDKTRA